jgi:hypothetical protein
MTRANRSLAPPFLRARHAGRATWTDWWLCPICTISTERAKQLAAIFKDSPELSFI